MALGSDMTAERLAAEMALASILGASRGMTNFDTDTPEGRALDRLRQKIKREVLAVLPYLSDIDG